MTRRRSDAAKIVAGTFRADRAAKVPVSPGDGLGCAPAHLGADLVPLWAELSAMVPKGAAGPNDRAAFEVLCRVTARIRSNKFTAADVAQTRSLLLDFGMLPGAPARLGLPQAEALPNKLESFLADSPQLRPRKGLSSFTSDD